MCIPVYIYDESMRRGKNGTLYYHFGGIYFILFLCVNVTEWVQFFYFGGIYIYIFFVARICLQDVFVINQESIMLYPSAFTPKTCTSLKIDKNVFML